MTKYFYLVYQRWCMEAAKISANSACWRLFVSYCLVLAALQIYMLFLEIEWTWLVAQKLTSISFVLMRGNCLIGFVTRFHEKSLYQEAALQNMFLHLTLSKIGKLMTTRTIDRKMFKIQCARNCCAMLLGNVQLWVWCSLPQKKSLLPILCNTIGQSGNV